MEGRAGMEQETHILMIEDDAKIANFMMLALKTKKYRVMIKNTGKSGIFYFTEGRPDIIILDLGLPDMDGNEIITEIRKTSQIPILVVSARELESDKIAALDAGANDYVTKPFAMGELLARIRVMERFIEKDRKKEINQIFQFQELTVDQERRRIFLGEEEVHLTSLEYKLLIFLVTNRGKVVTHSQIMKQVWGYEETGDFKSLRVCMAGLRRKIERDSSHPRFILTEIGVGYRFTDQ